MGLGDCFGLKIISPGKASYIQPIGWASCILIDRALTDKDSNIACISNWYIE